MFQTVFSFIILFDMGLTPSVTRYYSYALYNEQSSNSDNSTNNLLDTFLSAKKIYTYLAILALVLSATIGSIMLAPSILKSSHPFSLWIAWLSSCLTIALVIISNNFASILNGIGKVALVQRSLMYLSAANIIGGSAICLLKLPISVLLIWTNLTLATQFLLLKKIAAKEFPQLFIKQTQLKPSLITKIWSTTWRSGVGIFSSLGLVHLSGVLFSFVAGPVSASAYLMALQFIRAISSFSQAPFYSHIPNMLKLYNKKNQSELLNLAKTSMLRSNFVFALGIIIIGNLANFLVAIANKDASFVSPIMWLLLSLAFFVERIGAMHLQLFSLTNKIVWHKVNGAAGALALLSGVVLFFLTSSELSFPVALIIGYLFVYTPWSMMLSYGEYNISFKRLDLITSLPAVFIAILALFFTL